MARKGAADNLLSELCLGQPKGSGMVCRGYAIETETRLSFSVSCWKAGACVVQAMTCLEG